MKKDERHALLLLIAFLSIIALSVLTNCAAPRMTQDPFDGCDTIYQRGGGVYEIETTSV